MSTITRPIGIINYRSCNCASIQNMIHRLGHEATIADSSDELDGVGGLILPGVGSFDTGMRNLEKLGFIPHLEDLVLGKELPILGICLGMQLMAESSEEGEKEGLKWIKGRLQRFRFEGPPRPIPHMGWNEVQPTRTTKLFPSPEKRRFYFVHSYHMVLDDPAHAMTSTLYGYNFVSSVNVENIFGVQFHPEKSHRFGMMMLSKFLEIVNETPGDPHAPA
jgi:imidazole glycerol-phosphate synthase subunit HisH